MIIGGPGFWDKGGVDTGGCPQKNFPAAFGGRKIFRRRRHRGVKIFFRWGVYLVDRGVILPKNPKKWPHRGVKIFFPRGASPPGVHPPPVFFPPGVGQIFGLRGGAPPTVGCPSTGGCWKLEIMHFNGYYAHVRIPLDELSAKLTKFGSHTPLLPIYTRKTAKKGAILRVLCY